MRKFQLVLTTLAIATAAQGAEVKPARTAQPAPANENPSPRRIPYKELPAPVQELIEQIEVECLVPRQFISATWARALDVNADFRADFIYSPGEGNKSWPKGFGGLCGAADGTRLVLLTSNEKGGYNQVVLGSYVAILQSADDVIFTNWCGGSHADPSISLAVFDNEQKRLVHSADAIRRLTPSSPLPSGKAIGWSVGEITAGRSTVGRSSARCDCPQLAQGCPKC